MPKETLNFTDLFALWDSDLALAADMGVPRSRARMWMRRKYLDPLYWDDFTAALERRFELVVTADDLVKACRCRGIARLRAMQSAARNRTRKRQSADQRDTEAA